MNINQKVLLLAIMPMLVAMLLVIFLINFQAQELSKQQASAYRSALLDIRKRELINYTQLARSSLKHIEHSAILNDKDSKVMAKTILTNLAYTEDGYFYAYTQNGDNVVHPKQPYRIGKNWWDLADSEGKFIIQDLIQQAEKGGGFTEYLWEKPSAGEVGRKLGYAEMLEPWGWMFGTGIYIDDLEKQASALISAMNQNIQRTSLVIILIAATSVIGVFVSGLLLQLNERKLADSKLQALNKRIFNTQDEERRRVSRELHDGVSQALVAIKYSLEDVIDEKPELPSRSDEIIEKNIERLDNALGEVRSISRDLHPSILDDLGLMAAVEALTNKFQSRTGINVNLNKVAVRNLLPEDARTAVYRVIQEAITNIERHSDAKNVSIDFSLTDGWFQLRINDDGRGFDVSSLQRSRRPNVGIGLRNMAERLSIFKGKFEINSTESGTKITAMLPKKILGYKHSQETYAI